jgi:HlyD family secretion protein
MVVAAAAAWILLRREAEARYSTAPADRGDIAEVVGSTGTLQAVTTVQVGSQVSGTIQSLNADFNSAIRKGQVLARLDPSLFEARLGQAEANLVSAHANVERSQAAVEDTRQKFERGKALAAASLLPQSDLDTTKANYEAAVAQLKASQAAVTQSEAAVNQAAVDLRHTVITAPIDGVVIARNVDVGQTVAASFQAPVLFVIANDLSQMQVKASVDEADVGRVRHGQDVTFRVDSFPEQVFRGRVEQVRLQPTTVQNVVTYDAIIAVENLDQKLMPGMTATVSIIVRESRNALRIPAAALRFRPARAATAAVPGVDEVARAAGRNNGSRRRNTGSESGEAAGGSTIFVLGDDGQPRPVRVRLGLSDGQFVEVQSGLEERAPVITGLEGEGPRAPNRSPSPAANPFSPQFQRRQR